VGIQDFLTAKRRRRPTHRLITKDDRHPELVSGTLLIFNHKAHKEKYTEHTKQVVDFFSAENYSERPTHRLITKDDRHPELVSGTLLIFNHKAHKEKYTEHTEQVADFFLQRTIQSVRRIG